MFYEGLQLGALPIDPYHAYMEPFVAKDPISSFHAYYHSHDFLCKAFPSYKAQSDLDLAFRHEFAEENFIWLPYRDIGLKWEDLGVFLYASRLRSLEETIESIPFSEVA